MIFKQYLCAGEVYTALACLCDTPGRFCLYQLDFSLAMYDTLIPSLGVFDQSF
jgi:hypothetical protein